MASPQLENGYTKIANEILDALTSRVFSPNEISLLLFIVRKTYGWNQITDHIALSQFKTATGIDRHHASRTLTSLADKKIIVKKVVKYRVFYGLQKDHDLWKVLPRQVIPGKVTGVTNAGNSPPREVLPAQVNTKERYIIKETIQKKLMQKLPKKKSEGLVKAKDVQNVYRVIEAFKVVNKFWYTLQDSQKQFDAAYRMVQTEGVDRILKVIAILPKTNKLEYVSIITTPAKLEEKWSDLEVQLTKLKTHSQKKITKII